MVERKTYDKLFLVIVLAYSLGLPGAFVSEGLDKMIGYVIFIFEIGYMLFSSADTFMNIVIVNLKKAYIPAYLVMFFITVESMLVTSSRSEQIITCVRFSVTIFFALWVCEHFSSEKLLDLLNQCIILMVWANVLYTVLHTNAVFDSLHNGAFIGMYESKNVCASHLSFGIIIQAAYFKTMMDKRKRISSFHLLSFAIGFFLLVINTSTGAMFCVAACIFFLFTYKNMRLPFGVIYVISNIGFLIFSMTIIPIMEPILNALGKDATLTGRIPLWEAVIDMMMEAKTFTGYGYGHFWFDQRGIDALHAHFDENSYLGQMTFGSHNAVLELWLNAGLIGIAVLFIMILVSMRNIQSMKESDYILCGIVMIWFTLHGLTERSFEVHTYETFITFIVMGYGLRRYDVPNIQKETVYAT